MDVAEVVEDVFEVERDQDEVLDLSGLEVKKDHQRDHHLRQDLEEVDSLDPIEEKEEKDHQVVFLERDLEAVGLVEEREEKGEMIEEVEVDLVVKDHHLQDQDEIVDLAGLQNHRPKIL